MDKISYCPQENSKQPLKEGLQYQIRHLPLKRLFDIAFSLTVLTLASPLFFAIALAVRLTSKGASIYSHERVGRGGRTFKCYKFRTMYPNADERLKELLARHPEYCQEWAHSRKLKNDPRVTPFGAFLRRTSLDELPQFWNVLKGDLSVVGPRPVVHLEVEKHLADKAKKILSIRPGLTGLWQVSGRSDTSYRTRVRLDEQYVDNRSFWLDLKLIIKTLPAMIFPKGAY